MPALRNREVDLLSLAFGGIGTESRAAILEGLGVVSFARAADSAMREYRVRDRRWPRAAQLKASVGIDRFGSISKGFQ